MINYTVQYTASAIVRMDNNEFRGRTRLITALIFRVVSTSDVNGNLNEI